MPEREAGDWSSRESDDASPRLTDPLEWSGPSKDPNDEQFGDLVEATALDEVDGYDVVFVGEPYDGAVIGRKGAADGPAAIRESLAAAKTHHVDVGPVGSTGTVETVGDLGNVDLDSAESVEIIQERVRAVTRRVHDADALPVFLGGDNSLTFANAAPLLETGRLGALNFDAHLDCREVRPETGPTSGTPYRQLFEAGLDELSVVGARHFETSSAYHDYAHEQDAHVATPDDVAARPLDAIDDAIAALGDVDAIYVSVDVDVLDAAAAPGVSAPTPGGLTTRELYRMLDHVAQHGRVAGFEVVECAPPLDRDGRTVDAAARAVAHFLASLSAPTDHAARRGARDV